MNTAETALRAIAAGLTSYLRYSVEGFEHLREPGPKLLVGYHGRPIAWDLVILGARMHEHVGHVPVAIAHDALFKLPVASSFFRNLGAIAEDAGEIRRAVDNGRSILVAPGGTMESSRNVMDCHRVRWRHRRGYLKLAQEYRLPIVPIGAYGTDFPYLTLMDGLSLGRVLRLPRGIPLTIVVGPTGLFPFSLPFPVRIHQIIGPPIAPPDANADLERYNDIVVARVQANIDDARRLVKQRSVPYREPAMEVR